MSIYQSFANMVGMSNTIQPCTKDITAITINTGGLPQCSICNIVKYMIVF